MTDTEDFMTDREERAAEKTAREEEREERRVPHWTKRMAVKRFIRSRRWAAQMRIRAFFAVFFIIALIGLIIPLRPKTSTLEKRDLEKWPSFS